MSAGPSAASTPIAGTAPAAPPATGTLAAPGSVGVPPTELGSPAAGRLSVEPTKRFRPSPWPRLAVLLAMLTPAIALVAFGHSRSALWTAGLWGSVVCCGGTDSGWRWLNRLLVACAIAWLLVPLVLAT